MIEFGFLFFKITFFSQYLQQNLINTMDKKYNGSGTNLLSLSKDDIKKWINSFDCCLTDCDGVLWFHNTLIKGSPEVINRFSSIGKRVFFITNNSTKTREEFLEKAVKMKYNIKKENVLSTAYLVAHYLKEMNFQKKVYIVGSSGIAKELDYVGIAHTDIGVRFYEINLIKVNLDWIFFIA